MKFKRKYTLYLLLAFLFVGVSFNKKTVEKPFVYEGKTYKPGDTVFGFKQYIKLVVGDVDAPLLLGVPHDGTLIGNPEIPETGTTGRDVNTLPLAGEIASNFKAATKKRAWIIINSVGRKRVDPNIFPNEVEKRFTNQDARSTYDSYHNLLAAARGYIAEAQRNGKGALFLDLHGHAHRYQLEQPFVSVKGASLNSKFIDQTELGYGLSNFGISQNDAYLDKLADSSLIAAIAKRNPQVPFSQIIRGPYSFGGLLESEKVIAVPATNIRVLEPNAELFGVDSKGQAKRRPYFNGGYCTRKYGTTVLGIVTGFDDNISSIQAETPGITVRNNKAIVEVSAERFSRAIVNFLNKWYGYNYKN
ncbi:hypothetical protein [Pedobacter sp.]